MDRAVQQVVQEISLAATSSVDVPISIPGEETLWTDQLELMIVTEWQGDMRILGREVSFSTRLEPTETDNGIDDDDDGLVDEYELIATYDPNGTSPLTRVLATGVLEFFPGETSDGIDENGNGLLDEHGFNFSIDQDVLSIRLAMGTQLPGGEVATRESTVNIVLRN